MKSLKTYYHGILECYDVGGSNIRGSLVKEGKILYKHIENSVKGDAELLINGLLGEYYHAIDKLKGTI